MNTILRKTPSQKLENVFLAIAQQWAVEDPNMKAVTIRTGRPSETPDTADVPVPTLDIWAQGAKIDPATDDEWFADLHFTFTVQADDENAKVLDARVAWLIENIILPENVTPLVNFPLASRPEPDFMLQDVFQTNEESTSHDSDGQKYYREDLTFLSKFRNDNGQG